MTLLTLQLQTMDSKGPYRIATLRADTQIISIDLATYDSPYERLLDFIHNIITGEGGENSFSYDPEGPNVEFYTGPANHPEYIYFRISYLYGSDTPPLEGSFHRRQLAEELLKLCDNPYPLDTDVVKVEAGLQRLRALL